jgi:hypothetical protein
MAVEVQQDANDGGAKAVNHHNHGEDPDLVVAAAAAAAPTTAALSWSPLLEHASGEANATTGTAYDELQIEKTYSSFDRGVSNNHGTTTLQMYILVCICFLLVLFLAQQ